MAIAGLRGTGDWGTDERPKHFRELILWLNANGDTPVTGLMSKMKKQGVDDPEFNWWEETLDILRLTVNGALTDSETALVVDGTDARNIRVGDLLLVELTGTAQTTSYSNEIVEVTAVNSATSLTITRGAAGSTAAAIADDAGLTKIGSVFAEGTDAPEATSRNPAKFYNYCEIFKTTYELTNTATKTKARTGDPLKNDKKRRMFDHSRDLEMATIFGKRHETTGSNGKPKRYTGGLLYFLAAKNRILVKTAAYTHMRTLLDDVTDVFDFSGDGSTGGDERIVIAGNGALNTLSKLAENSGDVQFTDKIRVYGMNLREFIFPQGSFYVKSHPMFNRHPVYTNSMLILDPPALHWRPLRDTRFKDNVQANDADTRKGEWLTEGGTEFHHLETAKFITNISFATS